MSALPDGTESRASSPSNPPRRRLRIGEMLVAAGKLSPNDLTAALFEQKRHPGRRLGDVLVSRGIVSERDLAEALAREFALPFVDLSTYPVKPSAVASVPASIVLAHHALPIDEIDGALVVAVSDPLALEALDAVRLNSNRNLHHVVAVRSQLEAAIAAFIDPGSPAGAAPAAIDAIVRELSERELQSAAPSAENSAPVTEQSAGVIRLVNRILLDAYRRQASDVHVEPNGASDFVVVRFRVDGDCCEYHRLPAPLGPPVIARLKIMAELDIAERRKPQDGKIRFRIGDGALELRVATLPTVGGNEDVVLRLLPPQKPRGLEEMGLSPRNLREARALLAMPYGLILCVGPTGSGKTTTLHSALGVLNKPDVKIWTAEEPVEITQPGLRQVQVNRKIGFDFAAAMRSFLRADPDVIMVGEMRDKETATVAVEASLTGHLVLSTLHTNNAPETVVRLLDMGLDPFAFADSLLGVLAQRLVRKLCPSCRAQAAPTAAEIEAIQRANGAATPAEVLVWRAVGCEACDGSGYRGRIAIHELLVVDDAVRAAIARRAPIDEMRELAAQGGMTTLLADGVAKAIAGETEMRQVLAVCTR